MTTQATIDRSKAEGTRETTDEQRAAEELRESEHNYRTLFNAIDEGFCIIEVLFDSDQKPMDYVFLQTNAAFERQTGLIGAVGKRVREFVPRHEEHWFETYGRIALTGQPARFENRAEQLHRWYDVYAFRWGQPEERQVAVLFNDITQRKRAEEVQARLAAIVEGSDDGILSKALDGTIQTWNAGAERMFGYRAHAVVGQNVTLLVPPELHEEEARVLERVKRGEPLKHYETVRVTQDGRKLDVSLTISPVKDGQGRIIGASTSMRDIGEVVRARQVLARSKEELERLVKERTAKLREAMNELEHLSYSMVHDMRAPLRAMQSFAGLLEGEYAEVLPAEAREYARRIKQSASRLDRLVTGALNYNEVVRQDQPYALVELAGLLKGMGETYPNLQSAAADLHIEFQQLFVLGHESLLTQCFGNLLDNAVKFVAPGVRPQVRIWAEEAPSEPSDECRVSGVEGVGSAQSSSPVTRHARPLVRIWVEDNGIGIPEAAQERLFRLFQRLHREEEYAGTGTGLAIVRKAVERMGGCVGLVSEPGKGSRFWVELPRPMER